MIKNTNIIQVSKLIENKGQIEGVPKNPRFIKDDRFEKLKTSINDNPEFLYLREIVVYPLEDKFVIVGGNMRYKACKELGFKEIPCKVLDENTSIENIKAFIIKDNVGFGDNDWESLANEWDVEKLDDWGLNLPIFADDVDYSILDDENLDNQLNDMAGGVKKAIQIEFESDHYEEAYELVKFWRQKELYIGGFMMEKLKEEKEKL